MECCFDITQIAAHPKDLLKPMVTTGACVTQGPGLGTAGWRRIFRAWPNAAEMSDAMLSWRMLMLLLKH
jgi:hypothetical protein